MLQKSEQKDAAPMADAAPTKVRRVWLEWRGFVLFIIVMLLFRSAVADWNQVPTGSMIPSILEGDRIVVDKLAYDLRVPFTLVRLARWSDPQRSDIVTFESPHNGKLLVKRVIGVPGDEVQLVNNHLIINGEPASYTPVEPDNLHPDVAMTLHNKDVVKETLLGSSRTVMFYRWRPFKDNSTYGPVIVPPDQYLVFGDNRDNSQDSRAIGLVHRDTILGKANGIAFSLDYENFYLPRGDRFFHELN